MDMKNIIDDKRKISKMYSYFIKEEYGISMTKLKSLVESISNEFNESKEDIRVFYLFGIPDVVDGIIQYKIINYFRKHFKLTKRGATKYFNDMLFFIGPTKADIRVIESQKKYGDNILYKQLIEQNDAYMDKIIHQNLKY